MAKIATKKKEVEALALTRPSTPYRLRRDREEAEQQVLAEQLGPQFGDVPGILGVDPWPYSLRELDAMVTARDEAQWDHTATLAAAVITAAATEPCDPHAIHPYYEPASGRAGSGAEVEIAAEDLPAGTVFGLMKSTFVKDPPKCPTQRHQSRGRLRRVVPSGRIDQGAQGRVGPPQGVGRGHAVDRNADCCNRGHRHRADHAGRPVRCFVRFRHHQNGRPNRSFRRNPIESGVRRRAVRGRPRNAGSGFSWHGQIPL